jgi:UDP-glucose 4-epimerase
VFGLGGLLGYSLASDHHDHFPAHMKVLVTGGAGFIGSHIVEHLQGKHDVVVLDNFSSGSRANLDGLKCEIIEGSILDPALLAQAMRGVNYVFHLAAMVSVPESVAKPDECHQTNGTGTRRVIEAACVARAKKFVFSSSAAVYGDNQVMPLNEWVTPDPKSPYASSKLAGEKHCSAVLGKGLSTVCLRYFNVFGPRQNPHHAYAAVIPSFIHRALRNQPITIYGDGSQTRDLVYVKDVAALNVYFAEGPITGVFNVATGQGISINNLAQLICKMTGSKSEIVYEASRPGDVKFSVGSPVRLVNTDFHGFRDIEEALRETIESYCEHDWDIVSLGNDPAPIYVCSKCDKVGDYVNY